MGRNVGRNVWGKEDCVGGGQGEVGGWGETPSQCVPPSGHSVGH